MIKISTIVLLLSISFCSARIGLRDPGHWKAWNNIDLLNKYMGGFNFIFRSIIFALLVKQKNSLNL